MVRTPFERKTQWPQERNNEANKFIRFYAMNKCNGLAQKHSIITKWRQFLAIFIQRDTDKNMQMTRL